MGGNAGVREGELFRCARDITNSSINAKKFTAQSSAYVIICETEANGFKGEEDGKTAGDCERWENDAQTAGDF